MSSDNCLDSFIFCSILGDDEPSVEKELTYRKFIGAAFDNTPVLQAATGNGYIKELPLSDPLKAILSNYSKTVSSHFWTTNKKLFLDAIFGTPPDFDFETFKAKDTERSLISRICNNAFYAFSISTVSFKDQWANPDAISSHSISHLIDLFYFSPKLTSKLVRQSGLIPGRMHQVIYSIFSFGMWSDLYPRVDEFILPDEIIKAFFEKNLNLFGHWIRDNVTFSRVSPNQVEYIQSKQVEYIQKISSIINNNDFQELIYFALSEVSKDFHNFSADKDIGFKRLHKILEFFRYTDELFDQMVTSLDQILSSNYHSPIRAVHPILRIVFDNRRDKFNEMINQGLIKGKYKNPIRSVVYDFCIMNELFDLTLAKAVVRETSSSVIESVYDGMFHKNKHGFGLKSLQKNCDEQQLHAILSCLSDTKYNTALRSFAEGAPLRYLTSIIGKDERADKIIQQRFEAGK